MLGKLLKYDLKSIYKYWWVGAVTTFLMSVGGGIWIKLFIDVTKNETYNEELIVFLSLMTFMGAMALYLAFMAFSFLTSILIYVRFYKNFFSDEGYLTFTLPVKTGSHLNSKLISAIWVLASYTGVIILNVITIAAIGLIGHWQDTITALTKLVSFLFEKLGVYTIVYPIQIIVLCLLCSVVTLLFTFCCITLASVITKRARVITSIGIYYAATTILSAIYYFFSQFGLSSLIVWLTSLPFGEMKFSIAVILLVVTLLIAIICSVLYVLQYWMIDRKLNMA